MKAGPGAEEEARIKQLLEIALAKLNEAMESPIWSYTREFELGKLDVVKSILEAEIRDVSP